MKSTRPFDLLAKAKNKRVLVEFSDGKEFTGKLQSFDMYLNIVLRDVETDGKKLPFVFIRSLYGKITIL
jgi:small nuclear ribonucleoprotein (snRNP)-like protein